MKTNLRSMTLILGVSFVAGTANAQPLFDSPGPGYREQSKRLDRQGTNGPSLIWQGDAEILRDRNGVRVLKNIEWPGRPRIPEASSLPVPVEPALPDPQPLLKTFDQPIRLRY
jgi:hypothetical protein